MAVVGAMCVSSPVNQYRVIRDIRRSGGYVGTSTTGLWGLQDMLAAKLPDAFAEINSVTLTDVPMKRGWLSTVARSDRLWFLWLNRSGVTDDDLKQLAGSHTLGELYLNGNPITDQGLKNLGHMPSLERLQLNYTKIQNPAVVAHSMPAVWMLKLRGTDVDDSAVAEIAASLPALREIDLSRTRVTDLALQYLSTLPELESVQLEESRTSQAGAYHLHATLAPNCTVFSVSGSCLVARRFVDPLRTGGSDN